MDDETSHKLPSECVADLSDAKCSLADEYAEIVPKELMNAMHDGAFATHANILRDAACQQSKTEKSLLEVTAEVNHVEEEMQSMEEMFNKMQLYVNKLERIRRSMEELDTNMSKTKRLASGIRQRLEKTFEWRAE